MNVWFGLLGFAGLCPARVLVQLGGGRQQEWLWWWLLKPCGRQTSSHGLNIAHAALILSLIYFGFPRESHLL